MLYEGKKEKGKTSQRQRKKRKEGSGRYKGRKERGQEKKRDERKMEEVRRKSKCSYCKRGNERKRKTVESKKSEVQK